ncbi:hypothetical protein MAH1_19570 [Sessilibacter sp. MAH1]
MKKYLNERINFGYFCNELDLRVIKHYGSICARFDQTVFRHTPLWTSDGENFPIRKNRSLGVIVRERKHRFS